jgi:dTDP-4-amino-4,6-dideoxygalactose transaminase
MFSFGPIKTNTALGGAVLRVRNNPLREKMERKQDQWKFQTSFSFAKRVGKYAFVKVISSRPFCGGIYRFMKLFGKNHDSIASSMARGFAGPGVFERIRKQPSLPLLKLLHHKLALFDSASTDRRRKLGEQFVQMVDDRVHVLGSQMERQTFWVLPILVGDPRSLVQTMWDAGFDASTHCSLHSITRNQDSTAARILNHIVFLPIHPAMPINEVRRMAEVVLAANPVIPDWIGQNGSGADRPAKAIVSDSQFAKSPELVDQVAR